MKQQVTRLSPHQNAKVFAVLMTLGSLVFFVPVMLITAAFAPADAAPPLGMLLVMPVIYLVFGYLMTAAGCWIYNRVVPFIGGIEFESSDR